MSHDANACWICELIAFTRRWANEQMPGFLRGQAEWVEGEYRKYTARGIDKYRMGIRVNAEGTMFFMIDRRDISSYTINY